MIKQEKELVGDQAELKFFEMTKWKYSDVEKKASSPDRKLTVRILKVNQFKSELKRMSTVVEVQRVGGGFYKTKRVVCKGAPEIIKDLLKEVIFVFNLIN